MQLAYGQLVDRQLAYWALVHRQLVYMYGDVEASETRGTTALVYCLIGSSLYTATVQGWWSTPPTGLTVGRGEVHPNWSDGQQGRSQLSTGLPPSSGLGWE
jgi:hypothetical protein